MSDIDSDFLAKHTYLSDGRPESLDERLAREVPDTADAEEVPYDRQPDAVGPLVSEPDEGPEDEPDEEQDILARAEGPARADVGAEEAAMHLVDEDGEYIEEDYSEFTSDVENEGDEYAEEGDEDAVDRDDDSGEFVFDAEEDEG